MKTIYIILASMLLTAIIADPAYARKDRRQGFNFGSTIGVSTLTDRRNASENDSMAGKQSSTSQSFNPYFGYAIGGVFNIGATFSLVSTEAQSQQRSLDNSTEISTETTSALKSGSIFGRLLFGRVLYFELGGGVYHATSNEIRSENQMLSGNSFSGQRQEYNSKGMGPGYHIGAGIELPVTIGFYITSAYKKHVYKLNETNEDLNLGKQQSYKQKSELSFGVSYYY